VCSLDVSQTSNREQVEIDVMTLDGFADKHNLAMIDVIKIDTEGYEPWVFQGAQRLLQQHRIRLFIFEHLKSK
jgi:FkbM family methyltransferase